VIFGDQGASVVADVGPGVISVKKGDHVIHAIQQDHVKGDVQV
jgi:Zn-dependent alcohol dehydrogenase